MTHTRSHCPSLYRLYNDAGVTLYILVTKTGVVNFIETHLQVPWVPYIYKWETIAIGIINDRATELRNELNNSPVNPPLFTSLKFTDYLPPKTLNPILRDEQQARLIVYALRNHKP